MISLERIRAETSPVFVDSVYKTLVQYGRVGTHGILHRQFTIFHASADLPIGDKRKSGIPANACELRAAGSPVPVWRRLYA